MFSRDPYVYITVWGGAHPTSAPNAGAIKFYDSHKDARPDTINPDQVFSRDPHVYITVGGWGA